MCPNCEGRALHVETVCAASEGCALPCQAVCPTGLNRVSKLGGRVYPFQPRLQFMRNVLYPAKAVCPHCEGVCYPATLCVRIVRGAHLPFKPCVQVEGPVSFGEAVCPNCEDVVYLHEPYVQISRTCLPVKTYGHRVQDVFTRIARAHLVRDVLLFLVV